MSKQITGDEPANILTIRQEFAARAMQSFTIKMTEPGNTSEGMRNYWLNTKHIAEISVKMANDLIAELNK